MAFAALMLLLALDGAAQACPTCGAGMADGGEAAQKMLNGWFWSIVFMMSMPFAIVTSLGGYMYWIVRKARRAQAGAAASIPAPPRDAPPHAPPRPSVATPATSS